MRETLSPQLPDNKPGPGLPDELGSFDVTPFVMGGDGINLQDIHVDSEGLDNLAGDKALAGTSWSDTMCGDTCPGTTCASC